MNRRNFLKQAGVGGFLATAWPVFAQSTATESGARAPIAFTTPPSLQNPAGDAMTVAIGVNGPSTAWVEYGDTEKLGRTASGTRGGLKPYDSIAHQIRLEGLRPGQRCFYRVHACAIDFRNAYDIRRGEAIATEIYSFRTFDRSAKEARFAVWNDTHEQAETMAQLMKATALQPSDFHVWNGDIPNDNYREDRMAVNYLGAGGQPFSRETPLLFVRGNHDTRGPAARSLHRFQDTPAGSSYYSFAHGPLAGVVLDAGEDKPDTHPVYAGLGDFVAFRKQQAAWLAQELKRPHLRKARFRVAFCHIPLWWGDAGPASDANDPRSEWHRLLAKAKFSAIISGHTHRHALLLPDKHRPYAQLVGGGPKPEAATLIRGIATTKELTLTIANLKGEQLASWSTRG